MHRLFMLRRINCSRRISGKRIRQIPIISIIITVMMVMMGCLFKLIVNVRLIRNSTVVITMLN